MFQLVVFFFMSPKKSTRKGWFADYKLVMNKFFEKKNLIKYKLFFTKITVNTLNTIIIIIFPGLNFQSGFEIKFFRVFTEP